MDALMKRVKEIYGAIAGLPEDNVIFHDLNLTWIEMSGGPYGGVYNNFSETLENVFKPLGAEWDDFKFTPANFHNAGDAVAVEGDYTGVYKKTGGKVHARVVHLWKLLDGKIVFEQFTDTAAFWKVME